MSEKPTSKRKAEVKKPAPPRTKKIPKLPEEVIEPITASLEECEYYIGEHPDADADPRAYMPDRHVPELSEAELQQIAQLDSHEYFEENHETAWWDWLGISPPSVQEFGQIADQSEVQLIQWMDTALQLRENQDDAPSEFKDFVFDWIADKFLRNDDYFFTRLAFLLAKRKEGHIRDIKASEFGIRQQPGRKLQPYNLKHVFPLAVRQLLDYRCREVPPDRLTLRTHRITREELKKEIKRQQMLSGDPNAVEISDNELSRHIARSPVRKFME